MRKPHCWMLLAMVALFMGTCMVGSEAFAQKKPVLACYKWDIFPAERYKLNIKFHSNLTERKEEELTGHPKQVVFSVHGKHVGVCGLKMDVDGNVATTTRPVVGTLFGIPGCPSGGCRLGLETFATTCGPPTFQFCKDVEISCKSEGDGWPPPVWNCSSQNKHPVEHSHSRLILVDELVDPLCSEYEDGEVPPPPPWDCFATGLEDRGYPPCDESPLGD